MKVNLQVQESSSEIWGIVAVKASRQKFVWSPEGSESRRMNGTFPLARSKEEAKERVAQRIEHDVDFARAYAGWSFYAVDLTTCVLCGGAL